MAIKNLVMLSQNVADSIGQARTNAIDAAKTDVLKTVAETTVPKVIKDAVGVDVENLATKTEVNAVDAKADQNSADISSLQTTVADHTTAIAGKANADDVYTKSQVDEKISAIPKFGIEVVDELPETANADASKVLFHIVHVFEHYLAVYRVKSPTFFIEYPYDLFVLTIKRIRNRIRIEVLDAVDKYLKGIIFRQVGKPERELRLIARNELVFERYVTRRVYSS